MRFFRAVPSLLKSKKRSFFLLTLGLLVPTGALATIWHFRTSSWQIYQYRASNQNSRPEEIHLQSELADQPVNPNFSILIPKLGVNAPVKKNVDGAAEWAVAPQVLKGVGHYRHSQLGKVTVDGDLPGGKPGNIFLFGHSQIIGRDRKKNYAGVFDDLEELKSGDLVVVYYLGQKYEYRVKLGKVINKDDLSWVEHTNQEVLTLMSCWPLGLDWKRYVVQAERV